jgi:hypothetical protein
MSGTANPMAQQCSQEEKSLWNTNGLIFVISQTVCIFSALGKDGSMDGLSGCSSLLSHFCLIYSTSSLISTSGWTVTSSLQSMTWMQTFRFESFHPEKSMGMFDRLQKLISEN